MDTVSTEDEVTEINWVNPPHHRNGLHRVEQVLDVAEIETGKAPPSPLPQVEPMPWSSLRLPVAGGREVDSEEFLELASVDALLVLRGDGIAFERYIGGQAAETRHIVMSLSKSFCGMLTGILLDEGALRVTDLVSEFVPELAETSYGGATVRHLLDMTAGPQYDMNFLDPDSEVNAGDRAAGWRPRLPGESGGTRSFLSGLRGHGTHGTGFQYCSGNTDVLSWVLERAAGAPYRNLLQTRIWSRIGAESNAYITIDEDGDPYACAGMGMRLRDLARFGRLVLDGGRYAGHQVIPEEWIRQTRAGGDYSTGEERRGTYRNQWWITGDEEDSFFGVGIFGQYLWLDPTHDVVVAMFSSCPTPMEHHLERLPALSAIGRAAGSGGQ